MAITEDSRIQVLDEVLAAELTSLYSTLELFLDDPTYSEAKKIKIETLLQDLKDDIFSINQTLILKAYRSNVLEKSNTTAYTPSEDYHPMTLKYFKEHSESLTFGSSGNWSGFYGLSAHGKRTGNRFHVTGTISNIESSTSPQFAFSIQNYVNPGYSVYFTSCAQNSSIYESGYGYVTTDGHVYIRPGKSQQTWVFNIFLIS